MKYILLVLFSFSLLSYADDFEENLMSVATFKTEEFENTSNYKDGEISGGVLSDEFVSKLLSDEKQIRYFFVCYLHYHFDKRYKIDKIYTSAINKKFEQKENISEEQEKILRRSLASLVFTDSLDSLKNALPDNDRESDEYFLKIMSRLENTRLR